MKLSRFKLSFAVSGLFHSILFGVLVAVGARVRPVELPQSEEPPTITLIAAPTSLMVEPVEPPAEIPKPVPAEPPPVKPVEAKIPEVPMPPEVVTPQPAPIESVSPPQNVAPVEMAKSVAVSPALVRGDSSAVKPGLDPTTITAEAGIKAKPNYLKNPEPSYPLLARRRRQEGLVLLTVRVTTQGRAGHVGLKQSSGYTLLDNAAIEAVRGWEFEPARVSGTAIESQIEVPVRFALTE